MVDAEVEAVAVICYCRAERVFGVCVMHVSVSKYGPQGIAPLDVVEVARHYEVPSYGVDRMPDESCLVGTFLDSEQVRTLKERYPYRMINVNNELSILSKYPFQYVSLDMPDPMGIRMALFRFEIMGETVNLFNVHLESIGLNMADKELYQGLFDKAPGSERAIRKELSDVKHQLVSKLAVAFKKRADQARFIRHTIDSIGGNFIVAGGGLSPLSISTASMSPR